MNFVHGELPPTFPGAETWRRTLFYGILYLLRVAHFSSRNIVERFHHLIGHLYETFLARQEKPSNRDKTRCFDKWRDEFYMDKD
jgi:hypothetical protein